MCLTDGVLQAYVDDELEAAQRDALVEHLAACPRCCERAAVAAERHRRVTDLVNGEMPNVTTASATVALSRFRARAAAKPNVMPAFALTAKACLAAGILGLAALAAFLGSHRRPESLVPQTSVRRSESRKVGPSTLRPFDRLRVVVSKVEPRQAQGRGEQSRTTTLSGRGDLVEPRTSTAPTSEPAHLTTVRAPAPRRRVVRPGPGADPYFLLTEDTGPPEMGVVVRVRMPVSILAGVHAIPPGANTDPEVEADVLVGQDGRARAIRFVNRTLTPGGK